MMSPVQPVRWGLLSTARINRAVLAGVRQTDRAEVVAVASREQQRADDYAREHGIERAHGSYEALLDDPDVEVIYVSLPNSLHVEWSVRALEAGKHVLCEKPFDRGPREVERAFDAADQAGRLLMEAFMYRHHPQTKKLQEVVAAGAIGELRHLRSSFSFTLDNPEDVRLAPELDGGSLMDVGCYCLSISRLLAGEPEQVFVPEPFRCEDPHLDLNGERIDVEDMDRYQVQAENFSAEIRGEAEPLLGREDAVGQARAIDALYRSAASGAAVSL